MLSALIFDFFFQRVRLYLARVMKNLTIYIVEDDPIIGADLMHRLEDLGYGVAGPYATGEEAVDKMAALPPDLVLMDIQLEGVWDGIETARRMAEIRPVKVIFLTANSDDANFNRAKAAQPVAFLSKPFKARDLKYAIELALNQPAKNTPSVAAAPKDAGEENAYVLKDRLFVKVKDRMVRLLLKDILWIEADDYYCRAATADKEVFINQTLGKFFEMLAELPEFMRVHRSYVINLKHVEEIGELYLYIGKKQIPIGRTLKEELLKRIQKIS
jgi:DNA-binding LytR/AlgR family response regulator